MGTKGLARGSRKKSKRQKTTFHHLLVETLVPSGFDIKFSRDRLVFGKTQSKNFLTPTKMLCAIQRSPLVTARPTMGYFQLLLPGYDQNFEKYNQTAKKSDRQKNPDLEKLP